MTHAKVTTFLEHVESLDKPNFTHAQLVLLELDAQPHHFKLLQDLMENRFKLEHFDPKTTPMDQLKFNATQFQLGFAAASIVEPALRILLENNYKLPSMDGLDSLPDCLEAAESAEKPNFTHFQLRLQELGAGPRSWCALRRIMEKKFSLESFDRFI